MNLHSEIMNIKIDEQKLTAAYKDPLSYKFGHRDARHAAAELSLKAEARIEELEDTLKEVFADSGFSCLFDELQTKIAEIV